MRNLKKVLALVLAMAMSLSLAVTAGAAFNDQDKIVNTEAVDMCSALGIINGYTDGSFKPEGNVTRAEAAKMICIALNGGKEPVLSASATPVFADIAGHWAAKYIEYCNSLGIVAGKSATQFDPNGNVTGVELAKMLLIAIGYDAAAEKFVGGNWDTNVNVIASQKDLYEDLESIDPSVAATRDVAAQMVWNALNIFMVDYDYKLSTDANGNLTSQLKVEDTEDTLLTKKFQTMPTKATTGKLIAAEYVEKDEEYKYTVEGINDAFVTEANYVELLGQKVTFVAKDFDEVYGAFSNSVVVASDIAGNYEKCEADCMEINGVEYDMTEGAELKAQTASAVNHKASLSADAALADVTPYYTVNAIDFDDDGDIDSFVVVPVLFTEVSYVGADYIKLSANVLSDADGKYDEDYTVYEGAEKEDMVIVSGDMSLVTMGSVSKMEVQTGKVSAVKSETAVIGGETYNFTLLKTDKDVAYTATDMKAFLDEEVEFYAINGYLVDEITADTTVSLSDFAVVTAAVSTQTIGGTFDTELLFTDGTSQVVKGAADYSKLVGKLVTFDVDDDEYTLKVVTKEDLADFDAGDVTGAWAAAKSASDADAKIAGYKVAADAVVFVYDGEDYTVETGANISKVTDADATVNAYGADKNATNAYYVSFAYVNTTGVSESDTVYGYVVSEVSSIKDTDGEYETATVWTGSEAAELTTADKETFDGAQEGDFISYKVDADGAVTDAKVLKGTVAAVTVIDEEYVTLVDGKGNEKTFEIDDEDTVIMYVDADEKEGVANGSLNIADEAEKGYFANVMVLYTGSVLDLLVIDIDNDWYGVQ